MKNILYKYVLKSIKKHDKWIQLSCRRAGKTLASIALAETYSKKGNVCIVTFNKEMKSIIKKMLPKDSTVKVLTPDSYIFRGISWELVIYDEAECINNLNSLIPIVFSKKSVIFATPPFTYDNYQIIKFWPQGKTFDFTYFNYIDEKELRKSLGEKSFDKEYRCKNAFTYTT